MRGVEKSFNVGPVQGVVALRLTLTNWSNGNMQTPIQLSEGILRDRQAVIAGFAVQDRGELGSSEMAGRFRMLLIAAVVTAISPGALAGQVRTGDGSGYQPPRTADGEPDLQGIWQVLNTAAWD